MKKPFNYYAIRILNTVVFRRTVTQIKRVRSLLYKPNTTFRLEQVTYTGGRIIGSMRYPDWAKYGGAPIKVDGCFKITKEQFRALVPYMQKGE